MEDKNVRGGSQLLHMAPQPLSIPNKELGFGVSGDII